MIHHSKPKYRITAFVSLILLFFTWRSYAQSTDAIYSDGQHAIQLDVTADAHFEDTMASIYAGKSSPGFMLYPVGVQAPIISSDPPRLVPAPAAGPGLPVEFGTYSQPQGNGTYDRNTGLTTGMHAIFTFQVVSEGWYYLVNAGEYYQRGPAGPFDQPNTQGGPIRTRFIDIDSVSVINPLTPPTNPTTPIAPTVYVQCTQNTATKGDGSFLKYVFFRTGDPSQALTFNFFVQGTASAGEFNLNKQSPLTFPAGATTLSLRANPVANGIYHAPETVEIGVGNGGNSYTADSGHAVGTILSPDRPPVFAYYLNNQVQADSTNCTASVYVGQSITIGSQCSDPDGNLSSVYIDQVSDVPPQGGTAQFDYKTAAGGLFRVVGNSITFSVPGTYTFSGRCVDTFGLYSTVVYLTVSVPNRPPSVAWSVPGAYQVNANTWELDLTGASQPPMISATAADPDNRLYATLINRGTGDPSANQGTGFARTPGSSAGNPMTADEMLPPLSTALDSAVWEQGNQDNYSWFSASSQDLDGGTAPPIHLLVRVFNQAPTVAAWTLPAGLSPINGSPTDAKVSVYVNSTAKAIAASSADPEHKMFAAIISRGYITPKAGNTDGNEVGVGWPGPDGVTASPAFTPGAETFDAPGDHWFSAIGIDQGSFYSGGQTPVANHLDISVVNRQPTASFDGNATAAAGYVGGSVHLRGVGNDPDLAMQRVQISVVSAPATARLTAGQSLADNTAPANTQVYPSNLPTWTADADVSTPASGTYVFRATVWDRHGGTSQKDTSVSIVNRPPTFVWSQTAVHVLAGQAAALPYTVTDPDGNLARAVATAANYSTQATATGATSSGSFSYPTSAPGTFLVAGSAYDSEGLVSITSPTIQVVVEPLNTPPQVAFTSPVPGGASLTVIRFVDDVLTVAAHASDAESNLASMTVLLDGQTWAQASAPSGNVSSLDASNSYTVPALGAESSHDYVFTATATDKGTVPGGTVQQSPLTSTPPARLVVRVPNRAPIVRWIAPSSDSGAGSTAENPWRGYLLQSLKVTAEGIDRDANLATVTVTQQGGSAVSQTGQSQDGREATASFAFTPTVPGMYVFAAQSTDKAGLTSGDPLPLFVRVEDYPSDPSGTGVIGALVVSPASNIDNVFSKDGLPVIIHGGVAALGRTPTTNPTGRGPLKVIPVPDWLNGSKIPPLTPAILDLRTISVTPHIDHDNPAAP